MAELLNGKRSKWTVRASDMATRTHNPIRAIVDGMKLEPNPNKDFISLSLGDPTLFGNLSACEEMCETLCDVVNSTKNNGYGPALGLEFARAAVAKQFSIPESPLTSKDVVLACGCSGAIEIALLVLANPGDNVLVPLPGFSIYRTLAGSYQFEPRGYKLLPEKSWEADLEHMESLIDDKTACIVINSPSNPCGGVFTKEHLEDICRIAEKYQLPILADEIYAEMVFPGHSFHPVASVAKSVPVLTCGGLAKRYLVPGWRLGWILIHDPTDAFKDEVRQGLMNLATRILGPCTLIQAALPKIFSDTPKEFYTKSMKVFQENAEMIYDALSHTPGLFPVMPCGAMYFMFGIDMDKFDGFSSDMEFVTRLVEEESVFCLPGKCFEYPNFVRIVTSLPKEKTVIAMDRIKDFCARHYRGKVQGNGVK
ncbi:tyrosine aminotransferase-like isoform X1 [Acanthaster planci]|uniref:Tyrosine aminotransferase n=2 Tax=Acanthaster planci TaxID=133434 RepID=A0A8B7YW97_ACAPL|nr:tyrosine aminotransferase-like isoform X1 [Acanthaster planci]